MIWDLDPAWVRTPDGLEVRYYAFLLTLGVGMAIVATGHFAERTGISPSRVTRMLVWTALAALIGAHLTHLAVYEPESLRDPMRLAQIGSGFASHGAVVGALMVLAVLAVVRREDVRSSFDAWMSGMVFAIPFVRVGNLTNSELVGRPWDGPWALIFPRYDCRWHRHEASPLECPDALPRHPWPLYDAAAGLALIALAVILYKRAGSHPPGRRFIALFSSWIAVRFSLGFLNEAQAAADVASALTREQWTSLLSFPLGLAIFFTAIVLQRRRRTLVQRSS